MKSQFPMLALNHADKSFWKKNVFIWHHFKIRMEVLQVWQYHLTRSMEP